MIESHLSLLLDRTFRSSGLTSLHRVVRDYVLQGGKRVRPQLCVWTFERSGAPGAGISGPILDLACAWELFHAFLLAHDDIIDNADVRRDRPSLHRQLAALDGNSRRFGTSLGIVAGDLLFSAAMRVWHELDLPAEVYRRELKLFGKIACLTGFGQAIDICQSHAPVDDVSEEMLLREYHWKTAAYTFEGPMLSGAIAAGIDESAHEPLSRFALALGQAYQLHNDLLDLERPADQGCDLVQGKRTVTLLRARAALSAGPRRNFERRLHELQHGGATAMPALAEDLRRELLSTGAAEQTRNMIDDFMNDASCVAERRGLPASLRSGLIELLDSLRHGYFSAV